MALGQVSCGFSMERASRRTVHVTVQRFLPRARVSVEYLLLCGFSVAALEVQGGDSHGYVGSTKFRCVARHSTSMGKLSGYTSCEL